MASHLNPPYKYRTQPILSKPLQFQRGKGKIKTKKLQKKIKVKFKHLFLFFLILGGIFYFFQQLYLFLISWDNLNIKEIEIVCQRPEIKQNVENFFVDKNLGNIFLLDMSHIQKALKGYRFIKEVHVQKIYPSSLRIKIQERTPIALLKKEQIYLIDREGILLERLDPRKKTNLPLLTDSNNFEKHYKEKLKLALDCFDNLSPLEKEMIDIIDLSEFENVIIQLKGINERIILGNDRYSQKIKFFQKNNKKLEKYRPLEYVDLRFQDRIILKPQQIPQKSAISFPARETI